MDATTPSLLLALRDYAGGSTATMPPLAQLPAHVFMRASPEMLMYERADAQHLLGEYASPRIALADAMRAAEIDGRVRTWGLTQAFRPLLVEALPGAAARLRGEYCALRARLVPDHAAHVAMTEPQRLTLLLFFLATLRMDAVRLGWHAAEEGDMAGIQLDAVDFEYVRCVASLGLRLAVRTGPIQDYDLETWHSALLLLLKAMHVVGHGRTGASCRPYWDGLWHRFEQLVSLRDMSAVDAPPVERPLAPAARPDAVASLLSAWGLPAAAAAVPREPRLVSLLNLRAATEPEQAQPAGDVVSDRLSIPLPIVHGGRRLRVDFLHGMESVYHVHLQRMAAHDAFEMAAESPMARRVRDGLLARMPGSNALSAMTAFLAEVAHDPSETVDRVVREAVWSRMSSAHLMPGETERCVLQAVGEAAAQCAGMNAALAVSDQPHADEVMSALRIDDFARVARLIEGAIYDRVNEGYLAALAAGNGEGETLAVETERLAVLLFAVAMDASMGILSCPAPVHFTATTFLDELRTDGTGVLTNAPPATPRAALNARGQRTRCTMVRLSRRHFVVLAASDFTAPPITVEMPSLLHAMLVWLALAQTHAESGHCRFVHRALLPIVKSLRGT